MHLSVKYSSLKDFNINFYPGFAGKVTRLQEMKELLDDQWGIDTVYQDLYPNLLLAVEMGRMITYEPSHIATLAPKFSGYLSTGLNEVCVCVCVGGWVGGGCRPKTYPSSFILLQVSNLKVLKPEVLARVMATLNTQ